MKKTFGWLFIIAGSINLITSFIMIGNDVMGDGSQNPITKLFLGTGFIILGAYMTGAFKDTSVKQQKIDKNSNTTLTTNNTEKLAIDLTDENEATIATSKPIEAVPNLGEELRLRLVERLSRSYQNQFGTTLDSEYISSLADKVASVSKSYSDTSLSIMNIKDAIQLGQNINKIKSGLISISKSYSTNTMRNLALIGQIVGKQIIEIPHFTLHETNIAMEMIYQQGYDLISLAQQAGVEQEIIEILSAE